MVNFSVHCSSAIVHFALKQKLLEKGPSGMAKISFVRKDCGFHGLVKKGDELISVNGIEITDRFDMMYYLDGLFLSPSGRPVAKTVTVTVKRGDELLTFKKKSAKGDLGLEFDTFLMDEPRCCKNKCCFCFIDQLPEKMRETMYYKDDDYRLSIIYGNYVTLTNASREDIDRIKALHLSPLNISVHATDPGVRVRMMKNPNAKNIMPILRELADAGIRLKAQIVLCKGINDGDILLKSMEDLKSLHPALTSVSVVPVGLTKFREGLEPLQSFTEEDSAKILDTIEAFTDKCLEEIGTRLIYPSDEFFLSAKRPIPQTEYYEDFEQIENGVGMLSQFKENLNELMEELEKESINKKITMITGYAAAYFFQTTVIPTFKKKLDGLDCTVYPIRNDFFGEKINVAGLITGQDIIAQLRGKDLGETLIVPTVMLRDDAFLDDVTVSDIETELGVKVVKAAPEPCGLYEAITGNISPIQQ